MRDQAGCRLLAGAQRLTGRAPRPIRLAHEGVPGVPNSDHETRLARRSPACWSPLASRRVSFPGAPGRTCRNRPEIRGKTEGCPEAIPECEHRGDWVAEGAVSSEPVSPRFGQVPADCWTTGTEAVEPTHQVIQPLRQRSPARNAQLLFSTARRPSAKRHQLLICWPSARRPVAVSR